MDLDFLLDTQLLPETDYSKFYEEYDICAKQLYKLNSSILDKEKEKSAETKEGKTSAVPA